MLSGVSSMALAVFLVAPVALQLLVAAAGVNANIDNRCYRPTGLCSWYRQCLEKKTPCAGGINDYAVKYGDRYCKLLAQQYERFSKNGTMFINSMWKCLQVALVPLLRQSRPSCPAIEDSGKQSHIRCFLNPGNEVPTYCDLPMADRLLLARVINGTLPIKYKTLLDQMDITQVCNSGLTSLLGIIIGNS